MAYADYVQSNSNVIPTILKQQIEQAQAEQNLSNARFQQGLAQQLAPGQLTQQQQAITQANQINPIAVQLQQIAAQQNQQAANQNAKLYPIAAAQAQAQAEAYNRMQPGVEQAQQYALLGEQYRNSPEGRAAQQAFDIRLAQAKGLAEATLTPEIDQYGHTWMRNSKTAALTPQYQPGTGAPINSSSNEFNTALPNYNPGTPQIGLAPTPPNQVSALPNMGPVLTPTPQAMGMPSQTSARGNANGVPFMSLDAAQKQMTNLQALAKEADPTVASPTSGFGMAAMGNNKANRALEMLSQNVITPQQAAGISTDLGAILQGGSPQETSIREQAYKTLKSIAAGEIQKLTGKPVNSMPPAIKASLIDQINGIMAQNNKVIDSHLKNAEAGNASIIAQNPEAWAAIKANAFSGGTFTPSSQGGQPVQITTKQQFDALAPGTRYLGQNGLPATKGK